MLGYENDDINSEWIHTGDYARIDNGYLYLCGRKKNMILLSNGENVFPEEIEKKINESEHIKEVEVRVVDNLITAEIVLVRNDIYYKRRAEEHIVKVNKALPSYKRVKKIIVRETGFSKTSLHKIKRR